MAEVIVALLIALLMLIFRAAGHSDGRKQVVSDHYALTTEKFAERYPEHPKAD